MSLKRNPSPLRLSLAQRPQIILESPSKDFESLKTKLVPSHKKGHSLDKQPGKVRIRTIEASKLSKSPSGNLLTIGSPNLTASFNQSQSSSVLHQIGSQSTLNSSRQAIIKSKFSSKVKRATWLPGLKSIQSTSAKKQPNAASTVFRIKQKKEIKLKMGKEIVSHFWLYEKQIVDDFRFKKSKTAEPNAEELLIQNERRHFINYLQTVSDLISQLYEVTVSRPFSRKAFNSISLKLLEMLIENNGCFMPLLFYLYCLGKIFILFHETNKGILIFLQVKRICRIASMHEMKMHVYKYLAIAHQEAKGYRNAVLCLGKMLQLAWLVNNHHYESLAYDLLGMQFYYMEDIHKSHLFHERMAHGWLEPNASQIKVVSIQSMFNDLKTKANTTNIKTISEIIKNALMLNGDKLLIGTMEDSVYDDIDDMLTNVASSFESTKVIHDSKGAISGLFSVKPKEHEAGMNLGNDPFKFHKRNDISPFAERTINQKLKLIKEKRKMDHNLQMNQLLMTRSRPKEADAPLKASFTEQGIEEYISKNFKHMSNYEKKPNKNGTNRISIQLERSSNDYDILLTHLSACKQLINFMVNNENVNHITGNGQDKFEVQFGDDYNFFNPNDMALVSGLLKKLFVNFAFAAKEIMKADKS